MVDNIENGNNEHDKNKEISLLMERIKGNPSLRLEFANLIVDVIRNTYAGNELVEIINIKTGGRLRHF